MLVCHLYRGYYQHDLRPGSFAQGDQEQEESIRQGIIRWAAIKDHRPFSAEVTMKTLSLDLETYSSVDLGKSSVYRYVESPDFDILLLG